MTEGPDDLYRVPKSAEKQGTADYDGREVLNKELGHGPERKDTLINELAKNPGEVWQILDKMRSALTVPALKAFGNLDLTDISKGRSGSDANANAITYKNNVPEKMRFADGTERTFKRDNPNAPGEITTVDIKPANEPAYKWEKVPGKEQYTNGKVTFNAKFETNGDKYIVHDLDLGTVTTRTIDGTTVELNTKTGIETTTKKGELSKIKTRDNEITASRDKSGEISEIKDTQRNAHWQRHSDNSWQVTALDLTKPFKPQDSSLSGTAKFYSNGDYAIIDKDGRGERYNLDGSQNKLLSMADLRNKIEKTTILNADQKQRLLNDYLPKLESRQFIGKHTEEAIFRERTETIKQLSRLLEKPEANGYTEKNAAKC